MTPISEVLREVVENRDNNDPHAEAPVIAPIPEDRQPDRPAMPRRSMQMPKLSAVGAAMKGIPHELEKTIREMRERVDENRAHMLDDHITVATYAEVNETLGVAEDDPRNYHEAKQTYDTEKWETSYDDELRSIRRHNVWTLVPRSEIPTGRRILGCRTVFLRKRDENNTVS